MYRYLQMSKVDRLKQEEIQNFSLPRNEVKVVGPPDPTQHAEIHFPRFQLPEASEKRDDLKQEEVHIEKRVEVGSKTFNINDLIKKGLFDAAEYFLGRPLTPMERINGLMSMEDLRAYAEEERKKADAEHKKVTEKSVLDALAQLVKNTASDADLRRQEQKDGARLRGAAEHKDDDDDDQPPDRRPRVRDGEEKEEDEFQEILWDPKTKRRFVDSFGQQSFNEQSQMDMEDWTPEMQSRYALSLSGPESASSPMTVEELEEEHEQVERLREMKDILPQYKLGEKYTIKQASELMKKWREEFSEMAPPPRSKEKPFLFQPMPSTAKEWQKRLSDAAHEIVKFEQEKSRKLVEPVAPGAPMKPQPHVARMQGKGVDARGGHKAIEWLPFGPKWLVSPQRLREDDVLSIVKASNRLKTPKHPNRTVSAAMKVCLLEYLAGRPMPVELLAPDEQEWLKWLMHEADIEHIKKPPQKLEIKRTPKQIKERLAVLYGEIAEGPNDNPLVKKEFRVLFNQASLMGLLNEHQILNMQDFMKTF